MIACGLWVVIPGSAVRLVQRWSPVGRRGVGARWRLGYPPILKDFDIQEHLDTSEAK
jgi:hypothetical protein